VLRPEGEEGEQGERRYRRRKEEERNDERYHVIASALSSLRADADLSFVARPC
jgi:hypothetical protein